MAAGFKNFKELYDGKVKNVTQWNIKQLRAEQKLLQPIHEKYLTSSSFVVVMNQSINDFYLLSYEERVRYACAQMGISVKQGCTP